ncbi:TPA: hypothetical protein EYP44_03370 [Candidatus Bathyarchaeota archaeon]|nr:hypothetical protein [Candidatus Bathyarchaeota archaeon]
MAWAAQNLDPSLRERAAELINRFIRLMFFDQDPERPNTFEHYNPFTGHPCTYRGIDDYQHSWVIDLIIKYVVGLQPQEEDAIVLDPLPFNLEHFTLDGVLYKNHEVRVTWRAKKIDEEPLGYRLYVDGKLVAARPRLGRLVYKLQE